MIDEQRAGPGHGSADQPGRSLWSTAWSMGFAVVVPLVGLTMLGRWADGKLGTSPWMLLVGLLLGTAAGTAAVAYLSVDAVGKVSHAAGAWVANGEDERSGTDE